MLVSDLSPKDVGYFTLIDIVHLHMECNYEERQLTIIELTRIVSTGRMIFLSALESLTTYLNQST